jgi:glycosyltransferase involved in cell wall biosynthesis
VTLLSVVSGTYNRLPHLQRMIESVRRQMPRHLSYECVIVDGGSTDGTHEWCEAQSDIRLIKHGELTGAIKAFCDGARAAQGEYVILSNDDVEFHPGSILRAISYLEEHRTCGAVAFADDRHSQLMGDPTEYRVMYMPATGVDGKTTPVVYAQVGMFRKWLGERVGWWGDQDDIMRRARTYGGDNYLSSRIWEIGYSVDAVGGCSVSDTIARDNLRAMNTGAGSQDSAQYYARFPKGPQLQPYPQIPNPQRERMRILLMDLHEPSLPARAAKEYRLCDALAKVGLLYHLDYVNEKYDLAHIVRTWQPHFMLMQMHDTSRINADILSAIRKEAPSMVIVNFNGDAHERGLTSPDIMEALRHVDLQTTVNAKVLPIYEREGVPAAYWQFSWTQEAAPYEGEVQAHECLFQGNCYNKEREALIAALRGVRIGRRKLNLGVYGSCPGSDGNSHYDFAHQAALNRAAQIVIGDIYPGTVAFVSNRLFQVLGAGGFLLQQHSPRLEEFTGLKAGVHYAEWIDLADLAEKVKYWLLPEQSEARARIAECGMEYVRTNFTYDDQVRKLLCDLLPSS